ncbi:teichoic acid ABC transporter ATP-binding protein [Thermanaerothrix daxensis]|uniref:Teichoic acid ABC transporter ATP-binding protein n=1 Tax=Thermanaerothrix daxensis TaxID=869279 RepID=A0A0P6XHC1_9CHLR|nr:ABC transporter ATP-binding protein [Thermanaerothrix daxensis]KPL82925.1 teichoic acid ABC transporter ATP-binding protein [Thermanaerothrix daxensis]
MPNEPVIILQNVTVRYRVPRENYHTFKEFAIRRIQGRVQYLDLLALQDINLEIHKGEVFGLIGPNGAGKTTLLRLIAKVMRPTEGRVWVKGRIAPLLAIGAGFHMELTGRENIFLNGTLLGLTRREIEALFNQIVDFAELWDFIDAPLRTYSSGMVARLGFAVATARMPDVLIVDEVLSVGDIAFQEKSAARIREFREAGATILLVSHSMAAVKKMCSRAAWLDGGVLRAVGGVSEVIEKFEKYMGISN